jgi:hypothetical protein
MVACKAGAVQAALGHPKFSCDARAPALRFVLAVFVFDDNAHAHVAVLVIGRAEDPNTGIVHFNDDIRTHSDIELQDFHARGRRHRIAVKRKNREAVAAQLGGSPIAMATKLAMTVPVKAIDSQR